SANASKDAARGLLRNPDGVDKRALSEVRGVRCGDELIVRLAQGRLGLNDLDIAGDAGGEPIPRLRELAHRQLPRARRHAELLVAGLEVEERGADLVVDLRLEVLGLGPPVPQVGLRFEQAAAGAAALEDRNVDGAGHGEGAVRGAPRRAEVAVVGGEADGWQ